MTADGPATWTSALGLADRWADLAIATWSVTWNYGTEWEGQMLEAYGITRDDDRIAYYRLLWDLGCGELSGSSVRQQGDICCA